MRITPACAGKSLFYLGTCRLTKDHPRVCGEKRRPDRRGSPSKGITPACAGKSDTLAVLLEFSQDHPRVCGEKATAVNDDAASPGSPPRVRGKGYSDDTFDKANGITPACAGKSFCRV